ncbi:MAG: 2-hydroxychromene-2-carboxylate isomerase [Leptospiraceae bacterium]|nr:2-hydroxychromene-2-carboxylate isomerase [Leptospiraceae bacterium]MCB1314999.1 2-hydroxychromene-2-carboxylate isomerase [Leptospiraceae bacterium]MCB1323535.1 2-hydroxychromene-2-carboxylate isomerase [Leptospiraceae bacterium]
MSVQLHFYFEFASTYSHITAQRIEKRAAEHGVTVSYHPFLLGPIFKAQGWNDSPFNIYPAKGRYMWRDLERRCALYNLDFKKPTQFPRNGLRAARIATAAIREPWLPEFVRRVYRANFVDDANIADQSVLSGILEQLTDASDTIFQRSRSEETKQALRATTDRAIELGVFGAPAFIVESELFWGDDRLEDALRLAIQTDSA